MSSRTQKLHTITKRLILMTSLALAVVVAIFASSFIFQQRLMVSWLCFGCGLLGGFVSIQQRLKNLPDEELELLSESWFQILLVPVYGGIFSLVLVFLWRLIHSPYGRVLRAISLTPRWVSRAAICRVTTERATPICWATAEKLPSSTTRTKSCMASRRSIVAIPATSICGLSSISDKPE